MTEQPDFTAPPTETQSSQGPTDRQWAMAAHLSVIAAALLPPVGGVIGPAAVKFTKGRTSALVDKEATDALNFGITNAIAQIGADLVGRFAKSWTIDYEILRVIDLMPQIVGMIAFIFAIVAASQLSSGKQFRYPPTLRLIETSTPSETS